jgi:hypothetical protein
MLPKAPERDLGAAQRITRPGHKGTLPSPRRPAGLVVVLDDDHAVANAGPVLCAKLAQRLGIEAVIH